MKRALLLFGVLWLAILACSPGSVTTKEVSVLVTAFVDESGKGILPETYTPLPNTLVMARWNVHGVMYREVQSTDKNGHANFSVGYTHIFEVGVVPPCGYYSTTPLLQDMIGREKVDFGFWAASPDERLSRVKIMVWKDANSNGVRDPLEEFTNEKVSVTFNVPLGVVGNDFGADNFEQEADNGWFDINLGNSCGSIYLHWLKGALETGSVSAPGRINDGNGNVSIEIPYAPGETLVYWEIK